MEQNNKKNEDTKDKTTSIPNDKNEMSESHQQHYQQQHQSQRLSMESITPASSRLSSSTMDIGVNEGIGEDEEESQNFVSTLDVDAIKVSYVSYYF